MNTSYLDDRYTKLVIFVVWPEEASEEYSFFDSLKPSDMDSPEKLMQLRQRADQLAQRLALGDTKEYVKIRKDLYGRIELAEKKFGGLPANLTLSGNLSRFVNEDLADADVAALYKPSQNSKIIKSAEGGLTIVGAASPQTQRYVQFANAARRLYEAEPVLAVLQVAEPALHGCFAQPLVPE